MKPTNELDSILKKAGREEELEDYMKAEDLLEEKQSFSTCFMRLDEVKNVSMAELIRASGLDRTYAYQILEGKRNPSRDKEIMLSIAACLTEEVINRLLKMTGYSPLYARRKRDALLIYAVHQKMSVLETNALLDEYHESILQ